MAEARNDTYVARFIRKEEHWQEENNSKTRPQRTITPK